MAFVNYSITAQPYYLWIQYSAYNVIGGVTTLTFDSPPSSDSQDYICIAKGGILSSQFQFGFSQLNNSLSISGDTAVLTMPVVMEFNTEIFFYYQGVQLPFYIRAKEDYRFMQPAIFEGFPLKL